jgi:hypothetical protein
MTSIIRAMVKAVRTCETSVNFNVATRRYIPEDKNFILAVVRTGNLTSGCLEVPFFGVK